MVPRNSEERSGSGFEGWRASYLLGPAINAVARPPPRPPPPSRPPCRHSPQQVLTASLGGTEAETWHVVGRRGRSTRPRTSDRCASSNPESRRAKDTRVSR
eukprot:7378258-Prymnesium_polylepis.2